jgi:hypothetical protein
MIQVKRFCRNLTVKWNFELMKKNYTPLFPLILTVVLVFLSGCQPLTEVTPTQAPTTEQVLATPTSIEYHLPVVISPAADKTAVCGRIVRPNGSPLENLNIRLAEVYYGESGSEGGAFVLDTSSSPSAMTDKDGYFCTAEIAVNDYVFIIGNPEENYIIYAGEDEKAMVLSPVAGEALDLGEVVTDFDPDL